jgi:hypothetical protein
MAGATIAPSLPAMEEHYAEVENVAYWVRLVLTRLLAEVREQGTGNREQKEELRLKASKTLYF